MRHPSRTLPRVTIAGLFTALGAIDAGAAGNAVAKLPRPRFAKVNGVKLHYLDWGGSGPASMLFLTSLGGTAGDFQALAPAFTNQFRVLGLTRRGQGLSDKPAVGYGTSQLVDDIKVFLDLQKIKQVTLVGYSLAGNELTEFARLHPNRLVKLVYLDAAYDLAENAALARKAQLNLPPLPGADRATLALIESSNEYHPDHRGIAAPALGFFVTYDAPPNSSLWDDATRAKLLRFWNEYGKAYRREQIDRFQIQMRKSRVVELHNTTHGDFIFDKVQQTILIQEMRRFLSGSDTN